MNNEYKKKELGIKPHEVFISYRTSEGWEFALLMERALVAKKINAFLDQKTLNDPDIIGSKSWKPIIDFNIKNCKIFMPIFARNTVCYKEDRKHGVDNFWYELDQIRAVNEHRAKNDRIEVIPIIIKDAYSEPPTEKDFSKWGKTWKQAQDHWEYFDQICESKQKVEVTQATAVETISKYVDICYRKIHENDRMSTSQLYTSKRVSEADRLAETKRLEGQAMGAMSSLRPIFNKVVAEYDQVNILDIGCSSGVLVQELIGKSCKLRSLFGLDINDIGIKMANEKYKVSTNRKLVWYETVDLEKGDELKKSLNNAVRRIGTEFNIVIISLVLLHLEDPAQLIEILSDYVEKGGTVIIKDVDDGFGIFYSSTSEDDNKIYGEFNRLWDIDPDSGNRQMGRRIYGILQQYFHTIRLEHLGLSLDDSDTTKVRQENFDDFYKMTLSDFERQWKNTKDVFKKYEIGSAINWLIDNRKKLREIRANTSFFEFIPNLVFTAKKG